VRHKLLERQLETLGLNPHSPPHDLEDWQKFLDRITKAYSAHEQDRYLLERSLEISSKEMQKRWQSLKLLEEQWRSLGECTPDLVVLINTEGIINFANKRKDLFSSESLIGRTFKDLYALEHQEQITSSISKARLEKRLVSFEFLDQQTWYSLRISPILKGENLEGLIIVETDITEVRKIAQEVTARKKAEEAVETKARFLANMSHEIRTPLNGILGMANLLASDVKDEGSLHKLEIIQKCGETLLALINDILDFSKLEAGKFILEKTPFEFFSCLQDIVDLLAPKASEKGLLLHYKIENSVPNWILGDPTRVRQILLNLIGNAIKFTEKGEVLISASSQKKSDGSHEIRVSVKDTGIGISQETQERLFKSFSQVDAATTRKFGGTGLGLSICKGLVEAMQGQIQVMSDLGKGADFYFTFQALETAAQSYKCKKLGANMNEGFAKIYPLRILITEDNRVNQLVLVGFLKRLGFLADVAANGIEAVRSLERQKYDLILMDCHMPEMDGFEATKAIRQKFSSDRPIIIAATASTMDEDKRKCFEAGMDDILPKPITINSLSNILLKYAKIICDKHSPKVS